MPATTRRPSSARTVLLVVCLAQFMVILDISVVNVALPSIRVALHLSTTGLQWVVNAYTLTFAGFLMLGGRCADLLGRRRVFIAGTALFALSSLACALADSRGLLIGARALQGLGGAVLSPATLSIITSSLPEGPERNRGLGIWGAVGALGASSGSLLGGFLTQGLGWPAIFAVNVPLGAVVVVLALRVIPAGAPKMAARGNFDVSGAVLITASLVAITFGIVRIEALGVGAAGVIGPLALGVALLVGFVVVEGRIATMPLVPLSIFRVGQLRTANLVIVLLYAASFPIWFFITLYLQQVLRFNAIDTGLCFLPMTGSIFVASALAPRAIARFGPRRLVTSAMLATAAGVALLTDLAPGGSFLGSVLAGGVLSSVGMGSAIVPCTIVATQGVAAAQSGLASGLLNTARLMGGAIGLALLSTIAAAQTHSEVHLPAARALSDGFDTALLVSAALCFVGAAVAVAWLRPLPAAHHHEVLRPPAAAEAGAPSS